MKAIKKKLNIFCIDFLRKIVLPHNQMIALILTTLLTTYFAYQRLQMFLPLEPAPLLLDVNSEQFKSWNAKPASVKTGLQVINFPGFNLVGNEFVVDVIVWFEFDPALVPLEKIGEFSFDKAEIKTKSKPITKLIDGKFFAEYEVRFIFSSNVTHQFFPLDDHRIYITLINKVLTPKELIFEPSASGFTISNSIFIRGWDIIATNIKSGYEEWVLDKYDEKRTIRNPKVVYSIDFKRSGNRFILLILLPVFLIFFIGLFALGFNPEDITMHKITMNLINASLASLLAYRFVINNMAPSGVGYFMLSDHIFDLFMGLAAFELFLLVALIQYKKMTPVTYIVRGILFILFHLVLLASWYYLLFLWIK